MSNVNDYKFAKILDNFKAKILDPQIKRVKDAELVMKDNNHVWENEEQKKAGQAKYDSYKAWLTMYQVHYNEGMELVRQHENLVNLLSKWYDRWREDVSNEGHQETEIMSIQADILNEIFSEIYKELLPLGLKDMKTPNPLNLK